MNELHSALTIAIPVHNEEPNLTICLQAIGSDFARQVVVINSASTVATADVTRACGAELINFYLDCPAHSAIAIQAL